MTRGLWFRRGACAVLAAVLVMGAVAPAKVSAYMFCSVALTPPAAGSSAEYAITITALEYDNIDTLWLTFPSDTSCMAVSVGSSTVTVNAIPCLGGTVSKRPDGSVRLAIQLRQRLQRDQTVSILVTREAGIVNPVTPRSCYRMSVGFVKNGVDLTSIESDLYAVTPSAVRMVTASIEPAIASAPIAVDIGFITGPNGSMVAAQDYVAIGFPDNFTLPQSFTLSDVTLNGISCAGRVLRDDKEPNGMIVYVPVDVPAGSLVNVRIPSKAGLKAGVTAGPAIISVHTNVEVTSMEAPPVHIRGRAVTSLVVTLGTPVTGSVTSVQVHCVLSPVGRLVSGAAISIRLPVEYGILTLPIGAEALVNGVKAPLQYVQGVVTIGAPTYLMDGATIDIQLSGDVGIANCSTPGSYSWTVWTAGDTDPVIASALVQAPSASGATLVSSTRAIGRNASWTIGMTPSSPSTFPVMGDSITVVFDEAVLVPAQLGPDTVTVNAVPSAAVVHGMTLTVTIPAGVVSAGVVTVQIGEQAGIRTPAMPVTARVRVATTRDSTPVATNVVEFKALPVVTMVVTPDAPNGFAGRYIGSRPSAQLICENASLYYRIDGEAFQRYASGAPILMPEGTHSLSAYAVAGDGTEGEVVERTFAVDLSRPVVTIDGFAGDILVRSPQVTLTGTVSEPVELVQINGVPAAVVLDNTFTVTITVGDGQALACFARDLAGNTTSFVRTVRVDSIPPVIARAGSLAAQGAVHAEEVEVRVTVSEPATLTVNGQPMTSTGTEYVATIPLQKGVNDITVRAIDSAGNEGVLAWTVTRTDVLTIRLMVGASTAMVGDEERTLDAPPVIVNGVTFVPLRFISEALGADVTWNEALKVVFLAKGSSRIQLSIGSKLAIIDGRIAQLLEAPRIQNERTMVPLRFILEAFGADVTWDQATKAVTVALADAA